ncbi:MAG: TIGR03960 family B12-binding radical SAM protein [Kosmotoga sp.]|nr:MAG: TIGR03960 family B12-binding radical SAM protein [Kosmotoga sp.]
MTEIYKWLLHSGVLNKVSKPSRYIGKELNAVKKNYSNKLRFLLLFPDTYEIGMSHLGLKILYRWLNEEEFIFTERTYLPWKDMLSEMKKEGIPLYSYETYSPAMDFHIIGITLQYELSYTNVLASLETAGIPIWQKERTTEPLIVGGGPCTANPEPVADFFDLFLIGDGEKASVEISRLVWNHLDLLREGKRKELLKKLSEIQGVYIPSLRKNNVKKAIVNDLENYPVNKKPLVPFMGIVHDRANIELMRGCNRGCRFCQAGMFYRPVRERKHDEIVESIEDIIKNTGYDELSLLSLSTMDYTAIEELSQKLLPFQDEKKIGLSLPSSRVDAFSVEMASKIASIRKTGLTFAPEAGTQRLRNAINKNIKESDIFDTMKNAINNGWRRLKLYFMIGLPTETSEDLEGIVKLCSDIKKLGLKDITVSVATFIPKAQTPFQYAAQIPPEEAWKRYDKLKKIRRFGKLHFSDPYRSYIDGAISRGGREIARVIYNAYKNGSIFDEWSEEFSYDTWLNAFKEENLNINSYTKERKKGDIFPWNHIFIGIDEAFLKNEYSKVLEGLTTEDCRNGTCTFCGVCYSLNVSNLLDKTWKH